MIKEDLNFKKRSIAYMIRPQYRILTRVVNLWSLPLALVVGVLDLLQKNMTTLRGRKKLYVLVDSEIDKPWASIHPCTQGWEW